MTVRIEDREGNLVPTADNLVCFHLDGEGRIVGVDNGLQTSHESFQAPYRKAFKGLYLAVISTTERPGRIGLSATARGLSPATIVVRSE